MPEYSVEVLAGDDYVVAEGSTSRTVIEVGGPKYYIPTKTFGDTFHNPIPTKFDTDKGLVSIGGTAGTGYIDLNHQVITMQQMVEDNMATMNCEADDFFANGGYSYMDSGGGGTAKAQDITFLCDDDFAAVVATHFTGKERFRVWVDDEEMKSWYFTNLATTYTAPADITDTGVWWISFDFPDKRIRKIRVAGNLYSMGVVLNKNGSIAPVGDKYELGVVSDSYYEVLPFTTDIQSTHFRTFTGWKVRNMAVGGSGYLNRSTETVPMHYGADIRKAKLGVKQLSALLVNGSANDLPYTEQQIIDAMGSYFNLVREVQGNIPIFVVGIEDSYYFQSGANIAWTQEVTALRDKHLTDFALTDPSVVGVMRPLEMNWSTGTGNTLTPTGDGNADWKIGDDGVHLSPVGAEDMARRTVEAMRNTRMTVEGL